MIINKIKTQLMIVTILPLVVVITSLVLFMSYQNRQVLEQQQKDMGANVIQQVALMAEFPLYSGNITQLSEIADIMIKTEGIDYIKFSDEEGAFLVERGYRHSAEQVDYFTHMVKSTTVSLNDFNDFNQEPYEGILLGQVALGVSRNKLSQRLEKGYYLLSSMTAMSLVIGLVMIYFFTKKLRRAMNSLLNSASAIKNADYTSYCEENGTGELLVFQKTFNEMIDSLHRNDQESRDKIQQATAALTELVNELEIKNNELETTKKKTISLARAKAIEDERSRIMRDMHDGVGGQLVASIAMIDLEPDSESKQNIRAVLSECLDDFRLIINSLDTQANTLSTVLATFKYRMGKKLAKCNIELKWDVINLDDDVMVEPQESLHVLRIIQEAFTNILKHANATEIKFTAVSGDNFIQLDIEDNGDTSGEFAIGNGNGIKNMQWRAKELGGNIYFNHLENKGTQVSLLIGLSE
jgi:signal transduction histidine kinase